MNTQCLRSLQFEGPLWQSGLRHIAGLDEAVLPRPFRALGPNEPADRVIPPVSHIVYESTAGHYHEHLGWLQSYEFGARD